MPLRVLVVDDEETVRELLTSFLQRRGYDVVAVADGVLGVHTFRHAEKPFHCVISDFQMPRMNGILMLGEIRHLEPKTHLILQSGDPGLRGLMERSGLGDVPLLHKPWNVRDLWEIMDKYDELKASATS